MKAFDDIKIIKPSWLMRLRLFFTRTDMIMQHMPTGLLCIHIKKLGKKAVIMKVEFTPLVSEEAAFAPGSDATN